MVGFHKMTSTADIFHKKSHHKIRSAVDKIKHIPSNPVNTDTEGPIESVRINRVSALRGLNLEKM